MTDRLQIVAGTRPVMAAVVLAMLTACASADHEHEEISSPDPVETPAYGEPAAALEPDPCMENVDGVWVARRDSPCVEQAPEPAPETGGDPDLEDIDGVRVERK